MAYLPKIFISEPINSKALAMLEGKATLLQAPDTTKGTAISLIKDADAAVLRATTIFDSDVIEAGVRLRIIARTGIGVDNVNLAAAGEKGILVCNTPGTNENSVAEHTLAIIFAHAKQLTFMDQSVRNQLWGNRFSLNQVDIEGKRIGIIGYGQIGRATAKKCHAMGMEVWVTDPFLKSVEPGINVADDVDSIFSQSDYVSLHCPAVPSTQNIANRRTLALMKPGAYLINTSRGELVDEDALVEALLARTIAGAAIDVFKEEPLKPNHPFLQLDNLLLSPHVAGSTKESNERISIAAVQAVLDTLDKKMPKHICNTQYLNKGALRMELAYA